jgi:hypothetical protein
MILNLSHNKISAVGTEYPANALGHNKVILNPFFLIPQTYSYRLQ